MLRICKREWLIWRFICSNVNSGPISSSDAGGNGGGELFEKFQRQKMNREVNAGADK